MGLQNAIAAIIPEASLAGCWFHYLQIKHKMVKEMTHHLLHQHLHPLHQHLQLLHQHLHLLHQHLHTLHQHFHLLHQHLHPFHQCPHWRQQKRSSQQWLQLLQLSHTYLLYHQRR